MTRRGQLTGAGLSAAVIARRLDVAVKTVQRDREALIGHAA